MGEESLASISQRLNNPAVTMEGMRLLDERAKNSVLDYLEQLRQSEIISKKGHNLLKSIALSKVNLISNTRNFAPHFETKHILDSIAYTAKTLLRVMWANYIEIGLVNRREMIREIVEEISDIKEDTYFGAFGSTRNSRLEAFMASSKSVEYKKQDEG